MNDRQALQRIAAIDSSTFGIYTHAIEQAREIAIAALAMPSAPAAYTPVADLANDWYRARAVDGAKHHECMGMVAIGDRLLSTLLSITATKPVAWQYRLKDDEKWTEWRETTEADFFMWEVCASYDTQTRVLFAAPVPPAATGDVWQPIETAPTAIVLRQTNNDYGQPILVCAYGEVLRARWWQHLDGSSNFIQDGGRACFPTHWMPLPPPPATKGATP